MDRTVPIPSLLMEAIAIVVCCQMKLVVCPRHSKVVVAGANKTSVADHANAIGVNGGYFAACDTVTGPCRPPLVCSLLEQLSPALVCLCPDGLTWDLNLDVCTASRNFSLNPCSVFKNCSHGEVCRFGPNSHTSGFCVCKPGFERNTFLRCVPRPKVVKSSSPNGSTIYSVLSGSDEGSGENLTVSIAGPQLVKEFSKGVRFTAKLSARPTSPDIFYRWNIRRLSKVAAGSPPPAPPVLIGDEEDTVHVMNVRSGRYLVQLSTFTSEGDAQAELVFTVRSECEERCSGHGVCDGQTNLCRCDRYWMPNLVTFYKEGKLNCGWSVMFMTVPFFVGFLSCLAFCLLIGTLLRLACDKPRKKFCGAFSDVICDNAHYFKIRKSSGMEYRKIYDSDCSDSSADEVLFERDHYPYSERISSRQV